MRITGWRVRAEDREEWSRIVEQTKTHPGLYSQYNKKNKKSYRNENSFVISDYEIT
jgi:hypothetical protein